MSLWLHELVRAVLCPCEWRAEGRLYAVRYGRTGTVFVVGASSGQKVRLSRLSMCTVPVRPYRTKGGVCQHILSHRVWLNQAFMMCGPHDAMLCDIVLERTYRIGRF